MIFAVVGMALGVYYREATKWTNFYDTPGARTQLAFTHVHTLVLGMFFMLILGMLLHNKKKTANDVKRGLTIYLVGITFAIVMMVTRGSLQIFSNGISNGLDAAISGLSGLSHVIVAVGLIHLLIDLKKIYKEEETSIETK